MKLVHVLTACLLTLPTSGFSADADAGKAKSGVCAACHGTAGISTNPIWPNIAGQQGAYLGKQLKAFRDGSRTDPLMSGIAGTLSDEDIANLAAYYSSL